MSDFQDLNEPFSFEGWNDSGAFEDLMIKRARGFFVYCSGKRFLDCDRDQGRALLGHRPRVLREVKGSLAKGLGNITGDTLQKNKLLRAMRLFFPGAVGIGIFSDSLRAHHFVRSFWGQKLSEREKDLASKSEIREWNLMKMLAHEGRKRGSWTEKQEVSSSSFDGGSQGGDCFFSGETGRGGPLRESAVHTAIFEGVFEALRAHQSQKETAREVWMAEVYPFLGNYRDWSEEGIDFISPFLPGLRCVGIKVLISYKHAFEVVDRDIDCLSSRLFLRSYFQYDRFLGELKEEKKSFSFEMIEQALKKKFKKKSQVRSESDLKPESQSLEIFESKQGAQGAQERDSWRVFFFWIGPWLFPCYEREKHEEMAQRMRQQGVIISRDYDFPSVLPVKDGK